MTGLQNFRGSWPAAGCPAHATCLFNSVWGVSGSRGLGAMSAHARAQEVERLEQRMQQRAIWMWLCKCYTKGAAGLANPLGASNWQAATRPKLKPLCTKLLAEKRRRVEKVHVRRILREVLLPLSCNPKNHAVLKPAVSSGPCTRTLLGLKANS